MDETKANFEFSYRNENYIVKKKNIKNEFYCFNCNTEFSAKRQEKKIKDCLEVTVDFREWTIIFEKEVKGGGWFRIFKEDSTVYFCKVWTTELTRKIKEQDFDKGYVWTGELKNEYNKKNGREGQTFMSINFNKNTVNEREEV
jgi:hypothetical protein